MLTPRVIAWVLGIVLAAASGLVLLLAARLRDLSGDYRELRERTTLPHPGLAVPTFRTATLDGDSVTVGETADSGTKQVLFIFNTTCPFCRSVIPVWQEIADSLHRIGVGRVVSISLHPVGTTRTYALDHRVSYPVVTFPQRKLALLYRATRVPQTVVLDATGTVLYAKTGALDSPSIDSVYAAVTGRGKR